MLVLTRRLGESIRIGHEIKVVVVEIKGNQVRLGVAAPIETKVHRDEVYERIRKENLIAIKGVEKTDVKKLGEKLFKAKSISTSSTTKDQKAVEINKISDKES
ncbi:MAG: carbon storage regulator CsrA [SAR324 cluster bacterium]|nr:carbon storage regulator CsrA [SAR324 cluster bacterium]